MFRLLHPLTASLRAAPAQTFLFPEEDKEARGSFCGVCRKSCSYSASLVLCSPRLMNVPETLGGRSGRYVSLLMLGKKMEVRGTFSSAVSSFLLGRAALVSFCPPRLTSCPPASLSPWQWAGASFPVCSTAPGPMPSLHFAPGSYLPPLFHPPWEGLSEGVSASLRSTHFYG